MQSTSLSTSIMFPMMFRISIFRHPLEKEMATPSSIRGEIPWSEEPGGLQSVGSQRVGHGLVTKQ